MSKTGGARWLTPLAAAVVLLAGAATASAHVEVRAASGAAAGEIIVSVVSESLTADTISLAVRLPENVVQAEFPDVLGWTHSEETAPLDPPLRVAGVDVTTRVSTVTWTGGRIPEGQGAEFRLRVAVAEGTTRRGLAFPAVQTYSDGAVVRWIGAPTSDTPAGVLATAVPAVAAVAVTTTPTTPTATSTQSDTATTATTSDGDGGNPAGLIFALVGAAIAIGGVVAIIRARRAKK